MNWSENCRINTERQRVGGIIFPNGKAVYTYKGQHYTQSEIDALFYTPEKLETVRDQKHAKGTDIDGKRKGIHIKL